MIVKRGELVELVTGSPIMVVEFKSEYSEMAKVLYYDNGIKRAEINVDFLVKVPKSRLLPPTRFERINKDDS
jgi:hypothetical protein